MSAEQVKTEPSVKYEFDLSSDGKRTECDAFCPECGQTVKATFGVISFRRFCGAILPKSEFQKHRSHYDGLRCECRHCCSQYQKANRPSRPERRRLKALKMEASR